MTAIEWTDTPRHAACWCGRALVVKPDRSRAEQGMSTFWYECPEHGADYMSERCAICGEVKKHMIHHTAVDGTAYAVCGDCFEAAR